MSKEATHVYFIKPVGMDGPIKIGCSAKPAKRLLTFAAWSPFPLELIGSVPGDFADEGHLHRHFSDLHKRKEWFMSSPILRETIEAILAGTSIRDACKAITPKDPIRNQKRPVRTEDRRRFLSYGTEIRRVTRSLYRSGLRGNFCPPEDIQKIMSDWRTDRTNGHVPITPSSDQVARLDEFIANVSKFAEFEPWPPPPPRPLKDLICIPVFVEEEGHA